MIVHVQKKKAEKPKISSKKSMGRIKEEFLFSVGKSSRGLVLVALSEFGIVSVMIGKSLDQLKKRLEERFPKTLLREDVVKTKSALTSVLLTIENPHSEFKMPLDMRGTLFQRRVWNATRQIPAGQTSTYSEVAQIIKSPQSMRAVGSACTNNHFSLIVPTHRVLHKGDSLATGFSRSSKWQQALIEREVITPV